MLCGIEVTHRLLITYREIAPDRTRHEFLHLESCIPSSPRKKTTRPDWASVSFPGEEVAADLDRGAITQVRDRLGKPGDIRRSTGGDDDVNRSGDQGVSEPNFARFGHVRGLENGIEPVVVDQGGVDPLSDSNRGGRRNRFGLAAGRDVEPKAASRPARRGASRHRGGCPRDRPPREPPTR